MHDDEDIERTEALRQALMRCSEAEYALANARRAAIDMLKPGTRVVYSAKSAAHGGWRQFTGTVRSEHGLESISVEMDEPNMSGGRTHSLRRASDFMVGVGGCILKDGAHG